MIRLLSPTQYSQLENICWGDAFGARIWSNAQMYGKYPFCDVWVQEYGGTLAAVIARLEDAVSIAVYAPPDFLELQEFLQMLSVRTLLGERGVLERLHQTGETGLVLHLAKKPALSLAHTGTPRLEEVYALLCACETESFAVPAWEPFYLDVSHRMRHGGMVLQTISQNGRLVACAMAVAQTPTLAVLGAVAVHPQARRQGLGSEVVRRLLSRLPQPKAAVLCTRGVNCQFYQTLGFRGQSEWMSAGEGGT